MRLVNLPWLNRVDPRWLREVIGGRRYDRHARQSLSAGRPGRDARRPRSPSSASSPTPRVARVGVTALPECGTNDEVLAHHRLDVAEPRERAMRCVRSHRSHDRSVLGYRRHAADDRQGRRAGVGGGRTRGRRARLSAVVDSAIAGLTDYQIAVRTFEMLGVEPTRRRSARMVQRYEELLPAKRCRSSRAACCRTCARFSSSSRSRTDVRSYLLTGNTRGGARAKLTHYDLFRYFPDGAFAEDAGERSDDCCARARAGAACRPGRGRRRVRRRRHAARHRRARTRSARARLPWPPAATRSTSSRRTPVACVRRAAAGRRVHAADRRGPRRSGRRTPFAHEARHPAVSALWRATRLARRWYYARAGAYPDWRSLVAAERGAVAVGARRRARAGRAC